MCRHGEMWEEDSDRLLAHSFIAEEGYLMSLVAFYAPTVASFFFLASSSSGVLVVSCRAWMPPSCASSSFMSVLTRRCRANYVLPLKPDDVMTRRKCVSLLVTPCMAW